MHIYNIFLLIVTKTMPKYSHIRSYDLPVSSDTKIYFFKIKNGSYRYRSLFEMN